MDYKDFHKEVEEQKEQKYSSIVKTMVDVITSLSDKPKTLDEMTDDFYISDGLFAYPKSGIGVVEGILESVGALHKIKIPKQAVKTSGTRQVDVYGLSSDMIRYITDDGKVDSDYIKEVSEDLVSFFGDPINGIGTIGDKAKEYKKSLNRYQLGRTVFPFAEDEKES